MSYAPVRTPVLYRLLRRILRPLAWRVRILMMRAPTLERAPAPVEGFALLRITSDSDAAHVNLVEEAMRAAQEPDGLVKSRLAKGDVFFAWETDGRIVCFGWVTYQNRFAGPVPLPEAPGRLFLYNFYTQPDYRGRGLYPALLLQMRFHLGREKATEVAIEVNSWNTASINGIRKAGFATVGELSYWSFGGHWLTSASGKVFDKPAGDLIPAATKMR